MRHLQRAGFSPDAKRTLQGSCYDCTGQGRTRKRKVAGGPSGGHRGAWLVCPAPGSWSQCEKEGTYLSLDRG